MKKNNKRSIKASEKGTNVNGSNDSENSQSAQSAQFAQLSGKNENSAYTTAIENIEKTKEIVDAMGKTPCLPDTIFESLPEPLKSLCELFPVKRERDMFLLTSITLLGGIMSNISGVYDGREYYPNLYLLVIATASRGKGNMPHAKSLVVGKHDQLFSIYEKKKKKFFQDWADYKKKKKEEGSDKLTPPEMPNRMGLFIPANSSSASVIDLLKQFGGKGIIFETEADTLGTSFKQDWGNFSDVMRNSFHHETISASRKENNEYVEIKNPRLSVVLSGTPSQVKGILKNIEDGLVSRFMHYTFRGEFKWKDISPKGTPNLSQIFNDFSMKEGLEICNSFEGLPVKFNLTDTQWDILNTQLGKILECEGNTDGDAVASIITRSGVILFRIAMILSALRNIEKIKNNSITEMICDDIDFKIAGQIVTVLQYHAKVTLLTLPSPVFSELNLGKKRFMDSLPPSSDFNRADAIKIGRNHGIRERTVDKYLFSLVDSGFLEKKDYGIYARK